MTDLMINAAKFCMDNVRFDNIPVLHQFFFGTGGKTGNQNVIGIDKILEIVVGAAGDPFSDPNKILGRMEFTHNRRAEFIGNGTLF